MNQKRQNLNSGMVIRRLLIVLLISIIFIGLVDFITKPASAEIYKWKDENGEWHFSDQPPVESQDEAWWKEKGKVIHTGKPPEQEPDSPPASEATSVPIKPVGEGVLWKIEGGGISPSFILGTIHSDDPRVMNFSSTLESAFEAKDVFIMEVELDEKALAKISASTLFMDGRTLKSIIGEKLFAKAASAARKKGIPEFALNQMKPWAVMSVLSVPAAKTGKFMDIELYNRAKEQGKQIVGVETAEEQVNLFDSMPLKDQIALLKQAIEHSDEFPDMFERLIQTYISGDLEKTANLAREFMTPEDKELTEKVLKVLNVDRNYKMVDRMLPHFVAGDAFAAVGALHLTGDEGILNLLREKGFKISAVK